MRKKNSKLSKNDRKKTTKKEYSTQSEKKSAFAELNFRSLKSFIYLYLEFEWTTSDNEKLQSFVQTIKPRVNRVTKLGPKEFTRKHVPTLESIIANSSTKLVQKP